MNIYSCRCGTTWNGLSAQHCAACHQTLGGTALGDAHRVGPHDGDRRCLTTAEMKAKGWRQVASASGGLVWRGREMSEAQKQKLYGSPADTLPSHTDEIKEPK